MRPAFHPCTVLYHIVSDLLVFLFFPTERLVFNSSCLRWRLHTLTIHPSATSFHECSIHPHVTYHFVLKLIKQGFPHFSTTNRTISPIDRWLFREGSKGEIPLRILTCPAWIRSSHTFKFKFIWMSLKLAGWSDRGRWGSESACPNTSVCWARNPYPILS